VKDLLVVIRDGELLNKTLATISYDRFGSKTKQWLEICDNWTDGFDLAKQSKANAVLFVDSGTVFTDWPSWLHELNGYPHRGLIGHIVWKKDYDLYPWLHDQCWLIESDLIAELDLTQTMLSYPQPVRSEKNIHDNYTPLHLKPNQRDRCNHAASHFTQCMIAAQLSRDLPVVNWHQRLRGFKHYLYSNNPSQSKVWEHSQSEYLNLAENQFWILNNEVIKIYKGQRQLSPAAGLHWIMNICQPLTQEIDIVDISTQQTEFAQHLWTSWNGLDYGGQVIDFIQKKQLVHYELDRCDLDKIDRLKFKNLSYLRQYVNERFEELMPENFVQQWQLSRQTKTARFHVGNLIDWVINNGTSNIDAIWLSNIIDYKWTLLKSSKEDIRRFREICQSCE
jgi:hypothetical protein